jgi:multidrug efflux pump subunit AcrB
MTMEHNKLTDRIVRQFWPTDISLKNRSTVFLILALLVLFGFISYTTMPMELFPEINLPNVFVSTVYPGNPPVDMENLITRPLEREIQTIHGIKELTSISTQDNSDIFVEFNTNVDIKDALQDVKDAVDKARGELPNDLDMAPFVLDFDVNEFPIVNINLSGDFSLEELKEYAEYLEDEIEGISQVSKVEIKGLNDREIQINVDQYKMEAFQLTFGDIESAIRNENVSISGGDLKIDGTTRSIRTIGEFTGLEELENIIVKHEKGNIVYLKDVAAIVDGYADPLSFARLDRQSVVSVQVVKKSGENLLAATDKIFAVLAKAGKSGALPENLKITITNDQSENVRDMVNNLENSIVIGMIFVVTVLFFFLGLRNGLFVGFAIPMSMLTTFVVLNLIGYTVNMMVLFGLVLALGMLVDNAIVVVENIYRFLSQGHSLSAAASRAVGEIAVPIIASTATTLAAFVPLAFWGGVMGDFMKHLPITLIIVLTSSLFVALVIVPVLAAAAMKREEEQRKPRIKRSLITAAVLLGIALLFYLIPVPALASLLIIFALLLLLHQFVLFKAAAWFQGVFLGRLEEWYLKALTFTLKGKRPVMALLGTFGLLILVMFLFGIRSPRVVLFPVNEPSFVNITAELPIGSDITATNAFMKKLEDRAFEILEPDLDIVESVLTTVGQGAVGENETPIGNTPNKGITTITFKDYEERQGKLTSDIMKRLSRAIIGKYPGIQISIEKNLMGPPTGRPINIEISGQDFDRLLELTADIQRYIEDQGIAGIEGLKIDLDIGKPELLIHINREKARRFGLSTVQIAATIRTALFGKEVSDFKEGEEEYPIQLRLKEEYRHNISALMNQKITFRSPDTGEMMQVPISAVAAFQPSTTYGSVRRKDLDRVITLYSNIIEGYNAASINNRLKGVLKKFPMPEGYEYRFTGEQQEQEETSAFLARALLIALALILVILVTQFNSFAKPLIIMASVFFSIIGVIGGIAVHRMDFVIIMTGIGIISLAGIVVNNAIVLIDYIDFLKNNKRKEKGLDLRADLPLEDSLECIIQAGRTRLRPVLLTAVTTILGLTPMAVGMNINFATLFTRWDPQIYFGGDNALFWGPMAWAVIFGLTFATFLTLVLVPVMYLLGNRLKLTLKHKLKKGVTQ